MKNPTFKTVALIGGLVALAAIAAIVTVLAFQAPSATKTVDHSQMTHMSESTDPYASLMGDDFDEAYIADMLAHHDGAVTMAEQAQAMTAREEIRELAGAIVQTQSIEMMQMREWQSAWGYEITNTGGHNSHGGHGMDMSGDMVEMQRALEGLQGEAFDREFLKQMILHHEQAVEMSQHADTNAKHQEIKDLAAAVITAQQKEIDQMKQWQIEWGY